MDNEIDEPVEYIEYLGDPNGLHGVTFLSSHTISKGDPAWKKLGVEATQDLVWERDPYGPAVGFPGNRFLLRVSDIPANLVSAVAKLPGFQRVTVE